MEKKGNFLMETIDGTLFLRELRPVEMEVMKGASIFRKRGNSTGDTFLLNAELEIKDGVLFAKGGVHTDYFIGKEEGFRYVNVEVETDSSLHDIYKKDYFIGTDIYMRPKETEKFSFKSFKKEIVVDESITVIKRGWYLNKKGMLKSFETSNFRIELYEKEKEKVQISRL